MKNIVLAFLLILICQHAHSHPWKPSHYVIIDTDAGIDDMRAISMLIASNDVKVLGIIVSGGVLSPYDGYIKIKSMLNYYHHDGIPVAMNYNIRGNDMEVPLGLIWGEEEGLTVPETNGFNKLCKNILEHEKADISFLALASLNSVAELINGDVLPEDRIKEIIWSNNGLAKLNSFNAVIDSRSANRIIKDDLPLVTIGYLQGQNFYNDTFIERLSKVQSRYGRKIYSVITANPSLKNHKFACSAADEMAVIYLHYPSLFKTETVKKNRFMRPLDIKTLQDNLLEILEGGKDRGLQVMKEIPLDTSFYQPDIQPFMTDIIARHGIEEWESCVVTNELHRHLGIYSIIGVKMGLLAKEYFNVGVDELEVISYAGATPPLSCLNDGLQVSTGATTGHGLLEINSTELIPEATFNHNGVILKIGLKSELAKELNEELKDLNLVHGLDSDIYWEIVRQRAIQYWKNLSRYDIFETEAIDSN